MQMYLLLLIKWNSSFFNLPEKTETRISENLELKESRKIWVAGKDEENRESWVMIRIIRNHVEWWSGGFNTTYLFQSAIHFCEDIHTVYK